MSGGLVLERRWAEEVRPLRTRILRPDAREPCVYAIDEDPDTRHYALVDAGGEPRAVLTLFPERCAFLSEGAALRMRGLCVDPPLRGQGLGRRLVEGAIARAAVAHPEAKIVWCNARTSAVAFYEACAFERAGEVFEVQGIGPHVVMWKAMPTALA